MMMDVLLGRACLRESASQQLKSQIAEEREARLREYRPSEREAILTVSPLLKREHASHSTLHLSSIF